MESTVYQEIIARGEVAGQRLRLGKNKKADLLSAVERFVPKAVDPA